MKLDKRTIDQLLTLPDDRLWQMVQLLMTGSGVQMGDKKPDPSALRKLRAVLESVTDADIDRVMTLMALYKDTK